MEPVIVAFAGEYNLGSKGKLHRILSRLATKPRLVLDFSEVTYMDSTCIAELMGMERRRNGAGFDPAFVVMKAPVLLRIFTVLTLDRVFRVVPALADAIGQATVPVDYERVRATG